MVCRVNVDGVESSGAEPQKLCNCGVEDNVDGADSRSCATSGYGGVVAAKGCNTPPGGRSTWLLVRLVCGEALAVEVAEAGCKGCCMCL